jgi:hypothetical protein
MVFDMTMKSTLLGALALTALALPAAAVPVQFGANGYEYISAPDISWAAASAAAAGLGGHLATVTSGPENAFLDSISPDFGSFAGSWLGGDATMWLVGPEAGQSFTYTNWGGIEPNNPPSNVYMNVGLLFSGIDHGQWADAGDGVSDAGDPIQGYFVEYENLFAVPVPGMLALFCVSLVGLTLHRRRLKPQA